MSVRITDASTRQLTRINIINYRQLVFDRPCSNPNTGPIALFMPNPEPQLDLSSTFLRVHARNGQADMDIRLIPLPMGTSTGG